MKKTLRSAGGAVLLLPKFGSNEFVAGIHIILLIHFIRLVKNVEKPKVPVLIEQRVSIPSGIPTETKKKNHNQP